MRDYFKNLECKELTINTKKSTINNHSKSDNIEPSQNRIGFDRNIIYKKNHNDNVVVQQLIQS